MNQTVAQTKEFREKRDAQAFDLFREGQSYRWIANYLGGLYGATFTKQNVKAMVDRHIAAMPKAR